MPADHVEAHLAREGGVPVAWLIGELDSVVGQDHVDLVGYGFQQMAQELPCRSPADFVDQLCDREFAGAVDGDEQLELALSDLHLGDIDVEEADGRALEPLPLWLVAFDVGQA